MIENIKTIKETMTRMMAQERWLEAINFGKQSLLNNIFYLGKDDEFHWNIGWCYFKEKMYPDALIFMNRAVELDSTSDTNHWGLGIVSEYGESPEKAELHYLRALALKESSFVRMALATSYLQRGMISMAKQIHLEGLRIAPNSKKKLESYADFLHDIGDFNEIATIQSRISKINEQKLINDLMLG